MSEKTLFYRALQFCITSIIVVKYWEIYRDVKTYSGENIVCPLLGERRINGFNEYVVVHVVDSHLTLKDGATEEFREIKALKCQDLI